MAQRLNTGDIILQVNWRAYYLVVSANIPDQYGGDKKSYQFQLLAVEDKNVAPPEQTLTRACVYIDGGTGATHWKKVA